MRSTRRNSRAFTLIELLVVTSMLAVISLAIFATFSNGIKVYQRISAGLEREDEAIFFERLGLDLRNCFAWRDIPFAGTDEGLSCARLVASQRMERATVGRVRYVFDQPSGYLTRQQSDFSAVYNDEEPPSRQRLAVASAAFMYYFFDPQRNEFVWSREYKDAGLPLAVRLELEFKGRADKIIRTFEIPASSPNKKNDTQAS